jgi:hypothetical protein
LHYLDDTPRLERVGETKVPGRKRRFTAKEDRQAEHIIQSEMSRGKSREEAERIAYATVNKHKKS